MSSGEGQTFASCLNIDFSKARCISGKKQNICRIISGTDRPAKVVLGVRRLFELHNDRIFDCKIAGCFRFQAAIVSNLIKVKF